MTLDCPNCHATNRIPSLPTTKLRCGKCKYEFKPLDLVKAKSEPPAAFALAREDDSVFEDDPTHECTDSDDCGWEGFEDELEDGHCPECDKKVRSAKR